MGLLPWLAIVITGLFFAGSAGLINLFPDKDKIDQYVSGGSCAPKVESDVRLGINVSVGQEIHNDKGLPVEWVLVKKDAGIPGWKVKGNNAGVGAEMGVIGLSVPIVGQLPNLDADGKEVWLGIGHCDQANKDTDPDCKDPVTQDAVFIPTTAGPSPGDLEWPSCANESWGTDIDGDGTPDIIDEECKDEPGYWWLFNVYVRADKFVDEVGAPAEVSDEFIPCWAKLACGIGDIWGNERKRVWEKYLDTGECLVDQDAIGAQAIGAAALGGQPNFINKENITILVTADLQVVDQIPEALIFANTMDLPPDGTSSVLVGTYQSKYDVYFLTTGAVLTLVKQDGSTPYYNYNELVNKDIPQGSSLQLGTFQPATGFAYEWWTPACKPAIYLYPEVTTDLNVKVIPQGNLTKSIPSYPTSGWDVTANPSGKIQSLGKDYPYLFYEADIEKIKVPKEGWVVEVGELDRFFKDLLPKLGLNKQEQTDFTSYWVPKLLFHSLPTDSPYYYIGLLDREQLDKVEEIQFSQEPDNFIRLRFVFEALFGPQFVQPPSLSEIPARTGFTAVDWGGILLNGTCEEGIAKDIESK